MPFFADHTRGDLTPASNRLREAIHTPIAELRMTACVINLNPQLRPSCKTLDASEWYPPFRTSGNAARRTPQAGRRSGLQA